MISALAAQLPGLGALSPQDVLHVNGRLNFLLLLVNLWAVWR